MKKIIECLERVIKDMGLVIIEKYEDDFCTVIAVKHNSKGVFTVYTTQTAVEQDNFFALKMFRTTEYIPFNTVVGNDSTSFISRYSEIVNSSDKLKSTYSGAFCPDEFRFFVKCAG